MRRLVLALLALALLFTPASAAPAPRVLILGDSLANGAFASEISTRYAAHVAAALGATDTTHVRGVRDLPALQAAWPALAGEGWEIVVFEVGINDTISGKVTPEWAAAYAAIVADAVARGATVVCVTPFDIAVPELASDLGARAAAIRASCPGGTIADVYAATLGRPELHARVGDLTFYNPLERATDDIHPNDAGHLVVAERIIQALRPDRLSLTSGATHVTISVPGAGSPAHPGEPTTIAITVEVPSDTQVWVTIQGEFILAEPPDLCRPATIAPDPEFARWRTCSAGPGDWSAAISIATFNVAALPCALATIAVPVSVSADTASGGRRLGGATLEAALLPCYQAALPQLAR